MRLARGGGLGSLRPLAPVQGPRWSPLAELRREELRAYLRGRGVPWREDLTNADPFTARNRWRGLLGPLRAEAPELDRALFETHRQAAEAEASASALVAPGGGARWSLGEASIALRRGAWEEPELRWTLDLAFRRLGWEREADLLRGLAPWLRERLARGRKPSQWGHFQLEPEPGGAWGHLRLKA